jgi:hypothetical protein
MAIRSALALKSAKGLHRRRSFTEWFRTATSIEDLEIKVTIPFVPWITFTIRITRKMSLFTALSILLAALGVTAFFLLFRRG